MQLSNILVKLGLNPVQNLLILHILYRGGDKMSQSAENHLTIIAPIFVIVDSFDDNNIIKVITGAVGAVKDLGNSTSTNATLDTDKK